MTARKADRPLRRYIWARVRSALLLRVSYTTGRDTTARAVLSNPEIAAAALAGWHLTGLADWLRPQAEQSLITANLSDRFADRHKIQSTVADPLATGIDRDCALSDAKAAIAAHENSRAEIATVRSTLRSAIDFVAVTAGISVNRAHDLLTGVDQ